MCGIQNAGSYNCITAICNVLSSSAKRESTNWVSVAITELCLCSREETSGKKYVNE